MIQSPRIFRVFVSSTFSDLRFERDALQERVFPRLRELAVAHGCRFQAIDLRWGISEEAALDQQTMPICLGEIQRCQKTSPRPNFIILLGNRYGWQPLPCEIRVAEFERVFARISEPDQSLVLEWYRRDDNAVPPVFVLQPRSGEYSQPECWEPLELRLHAALEAAASQANLPEADLIKYNTSATEQEIIQGAIQVVDAREHIFCFARDAEDLSKDEEVDGVIDPEDDRLNRVAAGRLKDLKCRLRSVLGTNYHTYPFPEPVDGASPEYLDALCEDIYSALERVILDEVAALGQIDPLEQEVAAHQEFAQRLLSPFLGRRRTLSQIDGYLLSGNQHPFVLWGVPGSGKSALMAKAAQAATKIAHSGPVIQRFIGATPASSNGRLLLEGLCRQIIRIYGGDEDKLSTSYDELVIEFGQCLMMATEEKPLMIFLDGLDALTDADNARDLTWLPADLPPRVSLVVSTVPEVCQEALDHRTPLENRAALPVLSLAEAEALLDAWLDQAGRALQPQQRAYLLGRYERCKLPLFLKLAFEQGRGWRSYDPLPQEQQDATGLGEDIPNMLRNLFLRLSMATNHGELLVARTLGYLAAARNGLSEDEILALLSADTEVIRNFHERSPRSPSVNQLPVVVWSRLYLDLKPYLVERIHDGTALLAFAHSDTFTKAISEQYLQEAQEYEFHQRLAAYFRAQAPGLKQGVAQPVNRRMLSELPWQLAKAKSWQALYDLLATPDFFLAAWEHDEIDVRTCWAQLESCSHYRLVDAYQQLLNHPDQYDSRLVWEIARLLKDAGHPQEVSKLNVYLVEYFQLSGDLPMQAAVLGMEANIQFGLGRLVEALELHHAEEQICRALNSKGGLALTLINQAPILCEQGALDDAMSFYREAEHLFRDLGDKRGLAKSLTGQAIVASGHGDCQQALALYKASEQICRQIGQKDELIIALVNQSNTLFQINDLEGASRLLYEAEGLCRELGNRQWLVKALGNQANILYRRGKLEGAMELYERVAKLCLELGDKYDLHIMLNNQAAILEEQGEVGRALALHREDEHLCREMGNKPGLQNALRCQAILLDSGAEPEAIMKIQTENEQLCRELADQRELAVCLIHQAMILGQKLCEPRMAKLRADEAYQLAIQAGDPVLAAQIQSLRSQLG